MLSRAGYNTKISGKQDWTAGSHSLNVRLNAWTMYSQFPYNVNKSGGWRDETDDCRTNGTVLKGNRSAHQGDWDTLKDTVAWIGDAAKKEEPFFVYQGMNIVHPPYATSQEWYEKILPQNVDVPFWPPLESLHPCDFASSNLKGCLASNSEQASFYSPYRRRNVRRIYYAMIAEFDAMVGKYIDAVTNAGVLNNTVFIVTSDHGDQQMEKQQHYKMVPYDASASVPMVIADFRAEYKPVVVDTPTQLIDIFPTIMELARIEHVPQDLEGESLIPLLSGKGALKRSPFVVSQFHGDNIAMSWYLVTKKFSDQTYKMIVYGTGVEVPLQLFDLTNDPHETINLAANEEHEHIIQDLNASLLSIVPYPTISRKVAAYNKESFRWWMNVTADWKDTVHAEGLRWTPSWNVNSSASFLALERWLTSPDDEILPCRNALTFPSR